MKLAPAWTLCLLALLLTGCGTVRSDPGPALILPALVEYPPADQHRAADELDRLPPGSVIRRMIDDYGDLRARIRAAQPRRP